MGLVGHDYSFLIVSGAHTIKANQNKQNKNKTTKQEGGENTFNPKQTAAYEPSAWRESA